MLKSTMLFFACALIWINPVLAGLTNRYVVKNNAGAAIPYDSPANAAADIQTAINYSYASETVLVAAATYDSGGTNLYSLTNRVYISKAITVQSVGNSPATTIIKGAWDPTTTNGPAAVRCVFMVYKSSLIGFTLTNGATATAGDFRSECGGGIYYSSETGAFISNCVIAGNTAYGDTVSGVGGGGACYGIYFNCTFLGNSIGAGRCIGGGAHEVILSNCVIAGNSAPVSGGAGGGAHRGTYYGCLVSNNTSSGTGGGLAGWSAAAPCIAYNCTIVTNRSTSHGGGAAGGNNQISVILSNCTVAFNTSGGVGGGADLSTLIGCFVVSNRSTVNLGGGTARSTLTNCVVAYNLGGGSRVSMKARNSLYYGNNGNAVSLQSGDLLESCTFVGNDTGIYVDNSATVPVVNCISYSNTVNYAIAAGADLAFTNTCTYPEDPGWHSSNTTNNPRLLDFGSGYGANHIPGNYRLQARSPCVNGGLNQSWMTGAVDLDGRIRIRYGTVDMGAYEAIYGGSIYKFR